MPKKDVRVDAYIASSTDFAKPILKHLRKIVHTGCPKVEETIKWQLPTFTHHGILCVMAAFTNHCTFAFWKHALITDLDDVQLAKAKEAMGQFGRICSLSDLPDDKVLLAYVGEAVRLNELDIRVPGRPRSRRNLNVGIPSDFEIALKRNERALENYENFSPSRKREYVEWLCEAKREETRLKRLEQAIAWLEQNKPRFWKYADCRASSKGG